MPMETWSVSTHPIHFVVRVEKKLWVGFGLFKNCDSFFSTQSTVFGVNFFEHTDCVALPDDVEGDSFTLVGWGRDCILESCCKMFSMSVRFLDKFD